LLPYVERQGTLDLFEQFVISFPVSRDIERWREFLAVRIPFYQCPSTPDYYRHFESGDPALANFRATLSGADYTAIHTTAHGLGAWDGDNRQQPRGFRFHPDVYDTVFISGSLEWVHDGRSNTVLVAERAATPMAYGSEQEACASPEQWNQYSWASLDLEQSHDPITGRSINKSNCDDLYAFHPAGVHAVFCDGSVRMLSAATSGKIVAALLTRDNGEVIDDTQ
jgi:prepilin-type processing-associated H-X9-DG protein